MQDRTEIQHRSWDTHKTGRATDYIPTLAISGSALSYNKYNPSGSRISREHNCTTTLLKCTEPANHHRKLIIIADKDKVRPKNDAWNDIFDETEVYIKRVIVYWSRLLKSAEKNYSPMEKEALALKDALVKFQPLIEGEMITAITDHSALTGAKHTTMLTID